MIANTLHITTSRLHLLAVILLGLLALAQPSLGADLKGGGRWESLFNGKDLGGWVVMNNGAFTVTNGLLHTEKGMGWLRTEKEYTDFVLEAEWRALEANYKSGFFIRAGREGKPFPANVWQVNLKDNALGSLMKGNNTVLRSETSRFSINKWVKFRIEVRGKKLMLDVNDDRAWEFNGLDAARGYIGIQAEGKAFEFRNMRIQKLGTDVPPKHN